MIESHADTVEDPDTVTADPKRFGAYDILFPLGAGGMGEVFAARHVETGEEVALKTLSGVTATRLYRFKREFRALADVSHPNLIRLRELVVPETGPAFLTMERLDAVPFVEWVRASTLVGDLPEIDRLESALVQLVEGVVVLHEHDCIHRDLKPSNVLVTRAGRVVVLDFGIVSEHAETEGITLDGQLLGTPSYMAPEQAAGRRVEAAADFYAIGVMLFEALTGRLPHTGSMLVQLLDKQTRATEELSPALAAAPSRLRELCQRLLARDPSARPDGAAILDTLQATHPSAPALRHVFVGRRQELATLVDVFAKFSEHSVSKLVHVAGPSGYGKSALVRQFRAVAHSRGAIVLHGRCREREQVPYKGVDAVVDALSAYLRRLASPDRAALRPPDLDVLVRMFPVLDDIWETSQQQIVRHDELRNLGGVALGKLLAAIGERAPLVVHIDDMQWADLDSVDLLGQIVRLVAPPTWMLVLSFRSDATDSEPLCRLRADEALSGAGAIGIGLELLPNVEARALADALLPLVAGTLSDGVRRSRVEAIALRSHGNPFYISQLVRLERTPDTSDNDLDEFVRGLLADLDAGCRQLLNLVAVFGGPVSAEFALALCPAASSAAFASLTKAGLIVRSGELSDTTDERVEVAHDRIREVARDSLTAAERAQLHWRIGEHLSRGAAAQPTDDATLFELANHLDAGREADAGLSAERRLFLAQVNRRAAERALSSSAYATARRYLDVAHELLEPEYEAARRGDGEYELCVAVGHARAQTELALTSPAGDAITKDLLTWRLRDEDYSRIACWYIESLGHRAQFNDCLALGLESLARLGFHVPARPSWLRSGVSLMTGVIALRRHDYRRLRTQVVIPDTVHERTLEIVTMVSAAALYLDIKTNLYISGKYCRELARAGFHGGAAYALTHIAATLAHVGSGQLGKQLFEVIRALVENRQMSILATFKFDTMVCAFAYMFNPVQAVVRLGEAVEQRTRERAPPHHYQAAYATIALAKLWSGTNLSSLRQDISAFFATNFGRPLELSRGPAATRHIGGSGAVFALPPLAIANDLIDGSSLCETFLVERAKDLASAERVTALYVTCLCAFMLGQLEVALQRWRRLSRADRLFLTRVPSAAFVSLIFALIIIDIRPLLSRSEHRRARRDLRRHHATLRHFAGLCPENFQPMLDLLEGELADGKGQYERAVAALERARRGAAHTQVTWLLGLASERLAKLARRRGQALLAEAAFDAARDAYEAWGATAVVSRLDDERARNADAGTEL